MDPLKTALFPIPRVDEAGLGEDGQGEEVHLLDDVLRLAVQNVFGFALLVSNVPGKLFSFIPNKL